MTARIPVAQPEIGAAEIENVKDCLETTWISSHGRYIGEFENQFAQFCDVDHAIGINNGTTALHVVLDALGLGPGDEVIVPTVTYIATANAVRYCAATPVFADVEFPTMNIDPAQIEALITPRTKGIIPVHLYGHPANMLAIQAVANAHNLWVVEDAAEAHGARAYGKRVGGLGTAATFSFFANKIITTGEGGMVTTNDPELDERVRLLKGQGMDPKRRYWFPVVGYNYRMTNIQAAIGVGQMLDVDKKIQARADLARRYDARMSDLVTDIVLPTAAEWAEPVMWMYTIYLRDGDAGRRDAVMTSMEQDGVETRPVFHPLHILPPYHEAKAYPIADTWAQRGISLPTYPSLTDDDLDRVVASLRRSLQAR